MADYLFPTYPVSNASDNDSSTAKKAIYGPYFDISAMDIGRDIHGRVKLASEQEVLMLWCLKAIATERYSYMAYTDNYGVELDEAMKLSDRSEQEASIKKTITEALMADPLERIYEVREFIFDWHDGDSADVTFTVVTVENLSFTLSATLVE